MAPPPFLHNCIKPQRLALLLISLLVLSVFLPTLKSYLYNSKDWREEFSLISIQSNRDSTLQAAYFLSVSKNKAKPLLVSLHSWSADYTQQDPLATLALKAGWNYIHPDFRGANNTKDACLSDLVISDIDDAIQYAIDHAHVDLDNIFIVGASGGGYVTLGTYLKTRHKIKAFLSWVPISDLSTWYSQTIKKHPELAKNIIDCTSNNQTFNKSLAKKRSPLYWEIPTTNNGKLEIYAGINDGFEGSVPISHSINFYNYLIKHYRLDDQLVSAEDTDKLLKREIPKPNIKFNKIGKRQVLYKKDTPKVSITLFTGGHEMLAEYCFHHLEKLSLKQ
ncbi:MAG: prolyl oligopeptidase family serine peptidase [Cocleimonas sp.]